MKKDTQLTLRIRSDLKKQLESVAEREGRSVAQVCEAFLEASFENYKKEGTKLLQRFLAHQKSTHKSA
jgi:predicted HicB family RNase H-like nuclease